MSSPELPKSHAAGFVLTRPGEQEPEYLLLVNQRDGMPGLPKGHRDGREDDLATAKRETLEETGLTDLEIDPWFRTEIGYRVRKGAHHLWKSVVYFRAILRSGDVHLSHEHTAFSWQPLPETLGALSFESLREVLRQASLHAKDPAWFRIKPPGFAEAERHLAALSHADEKLLAHLRGGAKLARAFAEGLSKAGVPVNVEAAAVGTLLHDVGRAIGRPEDHQLEGLRHLRGTSLAPYGFACVSHFTKGATGKELVAAGVAGATVDAFQRAIDVERLTWEERCAALADACMKGSTAVPPAERFADLRKRYDAPALIDLQERRTGILRGELAAALGADPLSLVGLA